jgi:hypothetical protein
MLLPLLRERGRMVGEIAAPGMGGRAHHSRVLLTRSRAHSSRCIPHHPSVLPPHAAAQLLDDGLSDGHDEPDGVGDAYQLGHRIHHRVALGDAVTHAHPVGVLHGGTRVAVADRGPQRVAPHRAGQLHGAAVHERCPGRHSGPGVGTGHLRRVGSDGGGSDVPLRAALRQPVLHARHGHRADVPDGGLLRMDDAQLHVRGGDGRCAQQHRRPVAAMPLLSADCGELSAQHGAAGHAVRRPDADAVVGTHTERLFDGV